MQNNSSLAIPNAFFESSLLPQFIAPGVFFTIIPRGLFYSSAAPQMLETLTSGTI